MLSKCSSSSGTSGQNESSSCSFCKFTWSYDIKSLLYIISTFKTTVKALHDSYSKEQQFKSSQVSSTLNSYTIARYILSWVARYTCCHYLLWNSLASEGLFCMIAKYNLNYFVHVRGHDAYVCMCLHSRLYSVEKYNEGITKPNVLVVVQLPSSVVRCMI